MPNRIVCALAAAALLVSATPAWNAQAARPWEVYEVTLEAARDYANPYVEGFPDRAEPLLRAVFRGPGGQSLTLSGFWDGGRAWKVRFAAPAPGAWSWETLSKDPGLNGAKGTLECSAWTEDEKQANPARRGFVRVAAAGPRAGRYFEYADGTPFLWIGDTWWNWSKRGIKFETFQKLADDRAAKGFTVGQIFFAGNDGLLNKTYDLPDVEQIRNVERFIAYANQKGITVWIHPWWSRQKLNERISEEKMRRWWRYVMARLGAYNVIWVLAGEYNMNNYGGFGLQFWKDLGAMIKGEDPYRRIVSAHPTPPGWAGGAEAPQWSTGEVLHPEPWLDYNQSQVGHGRWRNEMIPLVIAADYVRKPAKPTVVTEPWYEFIAGNPTGQDIRFGAWSAILSGAAGHTYGGGHVWWAHVPEAPTKQGNWPLDPSFETNTLDYPGAVSMGFLARFLKSIDWWRLEPHPELVSDNPSRYCAAVPGARYVIYLRYGGWLKVDLRPSSDKDVFQFAWYDLENHQQRTTGTVNGGGWREFRPPEDYPGAQQFKDWLLHVDQ